MLSPLRLVCLAMAALILTLLAAELFTGWFYRKNIDMLKFTASDMYYYIDREGVRQHIPNKIGSERLWDDSGKVEIRINAFGYRGKDIQLQKPADTKRILLLGDSITFGVRVPEKEIFVERLERLLQAGSSQKIENINAGVMDNGIDEEIKTLKEGVKLQPDLVVLNWYLNDGRPPLGFPEEVVYNNSVIRYLNRQWWLRKSYLAGFLYERLRRSLISQQLQLMESENKRFQWLDLYSKAYWLTNENAFAELVDSARFDWGDAWNSDGIKHISRDIGEINDFLKKRGIRFCVVAFPSRVQVDTSLNGAIVNKPQTELAAYCHRLGIPYLDLLPVLRAKSQLELYFDFCHLTPVGNEVVARELSDYIRKML